MIKTSFISFFILIAVYCKAIANNKDSVTAINFKFSIHHEIIAPVIYPFAIGSGNSSTKITAWKYFTGGFSYHFNKKYEISLDYLFFEKEVNAKNPSMDVPNVFTLYNSNTSYWAQHHLYKQKYIWASIRRNFRKMYCIVGLGAGSYIYKNDDINNSVKEKNSDWCNVIDFGYKLQVTKRISISPYLGLLTAFSYKRETQYQKIISYQVSDIYDDEIRTDEDLKKVEIKNSNTVIRHYKYIGLMKTRFIPRFGVSISFTF